MFDLTILSPQHPRLALYAFSFTAFLITIILNKRAKLPRVGLALIFTIIFFSAFILKFYLLLGLVLAGLIIAIGGTVDEKLSLSPGLQIIWQLAAILPVVSFGWSIPYITNPFGDGLIYLDQFSLGTWLIPGSLVAVVWLFLMINAINWLDGVDGLASGVSLVAFLVLAAISLLPATQDSATLALSLIGFSALAAFLLFNWPPAKVYLGTSGSWFLGLYLGLAAFGGGKIATTLLVLSLPILDAIFVILQRLIKRRPPWRGGDQLHLHDRLRFLGFSSAQITLIAIVFTSLLGIAALLLSTSYKLLTIVIAAALLLIFIFATIIRHEKSR